MISLLTDTLNKIVKVKIIIDVEASVSWLADVAFCIYKAVLKMALITVFVFVSYVLFYPSQVNLF